jgi:hypothetical protein
MPGYYLVCEPDGEAFMVHVDFESDSHELFFRIPGDEQKYPLELWENALWYGPVSGIH